MGELLYLLRPILSRGVSAALALGLTWLGGKAGIDLMADATTRNQLVEIIVTWFLLSVTHLAVSVKTNPTNSASPSLSETVPSSVIPKRETPTTLISQ